ncbi:hypothetical protein QMK19_30480 [Streptomyces sp. H10-C2]|uniref:hypothetical protein n=1 Tax=unclassified Streptomyces TaxID=2593676 RepID=UPI0024BA9EB1|nr:MULTISPECIES: hypothetical protein [unclassified Streptomyces]MDJ0345973.1 hypothetical protein [Streptomyces sp. PH10-H1]MDJ0373860.1 hypothetical protein [Streptomyces sp. H10-C2]
MTVHWTTEAAVPAILLLLIVAAATARAHMASRRIHRRPRRLRDIKSQFGLLFFIPLLAVTACSSQNRATSPDEVRKLAGSSGATQVREQEEKRLRSLAQSYTEHTSLTLAMVTVSDRCQGGSAKQLFGSAGDDTYKINCSMGITAYYGADPDHVGDVLDAILTAGERPGTLIPFRHDDYHTRMVAYYRGRGPNPIGPGGPEPTELADPAQTLTWDPVRDHHLRLMVEEPEPCLNADPPVTRCVREPASGTVADIRKRYGMVFKLSLGSANYYTVFKNGQTHTT